MGDSPRTYSASRPMHSQAVHRDQVIDIQGNLRRLPAGFSIPVIFEILSPFCISGGILFFHCFLFFLWLISHLDTYILDNSISLPVPDVDPGSVVCITLISAAGTFKVTAVTIRGIYVGAYRTQLAGEVRVYFSISLSHPVKLFHQLLLQLASCKDSTHAVLTP